MKTLEEIKEGITQLTTWLGIEGFAVQITEDTYENTGNPKLSVIAAYTNLDEAYKAYQIAAESIKNLDTDSEYKYIELYATDFMGDHFAELDDIKYEVEYSTEDYGKFLLTYSNTNNAPNFIDIEVIDKRTKFNASSEDRYGIKYAIFPTNEECAIYIYVQSLHVSEFDAKRMFNDLLNDERYNIDIPND